MEIKTKKSAIPKGVYFCECYKEIILSQWWLLIIINTLLGYSIYSKTKWAIITVSVIEGIYFLFWVINLIGIQYLPQAKIIFSKVFYIFSDQDIKICIPNDNRINPDMAVIQWEQIIKIKQKKQAFILFLAKAHIIYLPFSIFRSPLEKDLFVNILKTKFKKLKIK